MVGVSRDAGALAPAIIEALRAVQYAAPMGALFASSARTSALAAVVIVLGEIDTPAVAVGELGRAGRLAFAKVAGALAFPIAVATVVRVRLEVDAASPGAIGQPRRAPAACAVSTGAPLIGGTSTPTLAAILGVVLQVDAHPSAALEPQRASALTGPVFAALGCCARMSADSTVLVIGPRVDTQAVTELLAGKTGLVQRPLTAREEHHRCQHRREPSHFDSRGPQAQPNLVSS